HRRGQTRLRVLRGWFGYSETRERHHHHGDRVELCHSHSANQL
ncbi:uncharacterized, partial [Tachysurus ichikawai]